MKIIVQIAGTTAGITTLEPKPVFTQEYFTLPPDGENCTVYPAIVDTDVYVIPQQSRQDNQFIHGDSFLLYCNDTISTPMIWFTFCWDSRWYPDPAQRFCYKTCNAPSVSSNVLHTRSDTGETSYTYYLHGNTIDFSCTAPDRSTLIGPTSSMCRDGTWDPASVPTCDVITSMESTTDMTEQLVSETPNPSSWATSVPTKSGSDATSASVSETVSTLDNVSHMTSVRRTKQTEGLTTLAQTPVQTESDQTDQPTSATDGDDVTIGTLMTTVYGASTLDTETTAMTSHTIRSDTVTETKPTTFTFLSYKPTEYLTSVNVNPTIATRITTNDPMTTARYLSDLYSTLDSTSKPAEPDKKTTLTSKLETSTTNPLTTETKEPGCVLPADFDPDITLSLTKDRYDVSDFIIMYCPPPPYTTVGGIFSQCTEIGWLPDISDKACYDPVCTLPTDLDPDIIVNPLKDDYILDDFILLYCPPIPYATRGTAFSLCIDGKWDPNISDNACYAPCDPPAVSVPVTYTLSTGLYRSERYTHDSVLEFTCSSGLLDGPAGLACIDGSWNPDVLPTCPVSETLFPASTLEPQPVFTQEYFTLPPDGQNCTTYPTILDDDIHVIPQQSRLDNQFIHGDSFLLYCNETISTPMIWFTFCWDSRWYPDPAQRFCYKTCNAPSVPSNVLHTRSDTGETSDTYYLHGNTIDFSCTAPDRSTLIGPTSSMCRDGTWDPASVPTCEVSSTTGSFLTTPLLTNVPVITSMDSTTDMTQPLGSETPNPSSERYTSPSVTDSSSMPRTQMVITSNATPMSPKTNPSTWVTSVPTESGTDATSANVRETVSTLDYVSHMTSVRRTNQTEGLTTIAPTPVQTESDQTDQPTSATASDGITFGTSVTTVYDASTLATETTTMTSPTTRSDTVKETQPPIFTSIQYKPTEYTTSVYVRKTTLLTSELETSTINPLTTEDQETSSTAPFVSPAQTSTNGRTGGTESLTTNQQPSITSDESATNQQPSITSDESATNQQPSITSDESATNQQPSITSDESATNQQPSITSDEPIPHLTVDHSTTTTDTNTDHTLDGLTSKQVSFMPSSGTSDMISTSYFEAYSTGPFVTDDTQTNPVSTEQTGTNDISTKSLPTSTAATTALDSFTTPFISSESTLEQQTIEPTKSLTTQTSHSTTTTANPSSAPTIGNTVDGATDQPKVTSETEAATQKTTYMLRTTEKGIAEGTTKTPAEATEQSTTAKRVTTSQQETTQGTGHPGDNQN
ncbi:mucin-5AC-like [Strongylocentrotus purpuratus]|uniref:Sushi domain-containing protein n=1 Tax=Strongylocentrotus purpuratus TaxID=7668 RepID=A0A7M7SZU8_STRPU|nr:mucin-5AC-like [Strongylocentrotus purpuratus]